MRIGIDLSMLVYAGSGVANYTYNLARALLTHDHTNQYVFFYASLRRPHGFTLLADLRQLGADIRAFPIPSRLLRLFWNRFHFFPVEWLIGPVDAYFTSDYLRPPLRHQTLGVTTVHDLTWAKFPEFHTPDVIAEHQRKMARLIKLGDLIIVDSESTKTDLLLYYPQIVKTNRIEVLYPGISTHFAPVPKKQIHAVLSRYHVSSPYLLYVGAIEPRKNLLLTLDLFSKLIKDSQYQDYHFVLIGRAGWKNSEVYTRAQAPDLRSRVQFLGYVPDQDLPAFYSGAKANLYLSHYEGFGLPPLEALACGTLTLLYSHSSLQELFPASYPFAKKGQELSTLKKLISGSSRPYTKAHNFTWSTFVKEFVKITRDEYAKKIS